MNAVGNANFLDVNNAANRTSFVGGYNAGPGKFLLLDYITGISQIGDIDGRLNSSVFSIDDGLQTAKIALSGVTQEWDKGQSYQVKGQRVNRRSISTSDTIIISDFYIAIEGEVGNVRVALPPAASVGMGAMYVVKDVSGLATIHALSIIPSGGESIDETFGPVTLTNNFQAITLVSDGDKNWELI